MVFICNFFDLLRYENAYKGEVQFVVLERLFFFNANGYQVSFQRKAIIYTNCNEKIILRKLDQNGSEIKL